MKFCPNCGSPVEATNFCQSCGFNLKQYAETVAAFNNPASAPSGSAAEHKVERHKVAGTSYRQADIRELGIENDDYTLTKRELEDCFAEYEKVYQFDFYPSNVQLIEEPENEHDPNAIKVVIDGVHVGYIKAGSCSHVKKLLRENKISSISAEISGGKYKMLVPGDDYDSFDLDRDSSPFFVTVELHIR